MKWHIHTKSILTLLFLSTAIAQIKCDYDQHRSRVILSEAKIQAIDEVVNRLYENEQFSGAVLVSVHGNVVYKKAVGYADIVDSIPNTTDTKFRIASFTKPFTAMLILQLAEEGLVSLDGKLKDYLPEYSVAGSDNITIHQLLTHTAGITGHPRIQNLEDIEKMHYTREELLQLIMTYDLVYEPGEDREYSNFGYALLALVIEKVTGRSYDEVMSDRICRLAGMTNTLSDITEQHMEKRAVGYTHDYISGLEEAPYLDMSFVLGCGQLLSTVEDLYLFDKALYSEKLLSNKSKELFFGTYGWFPTRYRYGSGSKRIACYNLEGSINGFQSHTQRIEQDTILIVALRNVKEALYENQIVIKWPDAIASPILSILYDEEYELVRMSGAFVVFRTLIESGSHEAKKTIKEVTGSSRDKYYLDKGELRFFQDLLRRNSRTEQAEEYRILTMPE